MTDNSIRPALPTVKPQLAALAISSLVLGLMSFALPVLAFVFLSLSHHEIFYEIQFLPLISSVAASLTGIGMGVVAYWQIARSGGQLRGKGMALAGAIVSLAFLLLAGGGFLLLAYALRDFPHQT